MSGENNSNRREVKTKELAGAIRRLAEKKEETMVLAVFADIRNFTSWAAKHSLNIAPVVTAFSVFALRFGEKLAGVLGSDGSSTLVKMLGDGVLIVVPCKEPDSETVKRLAEVLTEMSEVWTRVFCPVLKKTIRCRPPEEIGVGVSMGPAIVLEIETEGEERKDYFGSVLNRAQRLSGLARPKGVIIDAEAMYELKDHINQGAIKGWRDETFFVPDFGRVRVFCTDDVARTQLREYLKSRIEVHAAGICLRKTSNGWEVLLGCRKQSRELYPGYWDTGGGHMVSGETFEETVRRQHREEFGIESEPICVVDTYSISPNRERPLIPGLCLACRYVSGEPRKSSDEFEQIEWVPVSRVGKGKYARIIPGIPKQIQKAISILESTTAGSV